MRELFIVGAGGFGREAVWTVERINKAPGGPVWKVIGFADDDPAKVSGNFEGYPMLGSVEKASADHPGASVFIAIGDNSRVLKWICQRIEGKVGCNATAIGNLPKFDDIDLSNNEGKAGFTVVPADLKEILKVDVDGWKKEIATVGASYDEYDAKASKDSTARSATARRVPKALRQVLADVAAALG